MEILEKIKKQLNNNPDVTQRQFFIGGKNVYLLFIKSTIDKTLLVHSVITPLLDYSGEISLDILSSSVLRAAEIEKIEEDEFVKKLLRSKVLLFVEGEQKALAIDMEFFPTRQPSEPPTSPTIQGPREGFTETLKTNLSLIRKRLTSKDLKIEELVVGKRTKTRINLLYFNDIADKRVVEEIKKKLNMFEIDGIIDSYYIVKFLEDRPKSIFRQVGNCEKPDIACAKLLEGRVAILVDGSPICLTVPFVMFEDFQSSNDYSANNHKVAILRIIRVLGLFISIFLPAMYISLQLYHYKVLPLKFLGFISTGLPHPNPAKSNISIHAQKNKNMCINAKNNYKYMIKH